jgi:ElaB/YqjD/DUF883 family membrane-anchored ribosome-binding protein
MAENVERIVNTTVARADSLKVSTADALEEAARKLREADLSGRGEDVKAAISDAEARIDQLKADIGKKVEPMETFIVDHPLASVLIAVGVGFIVGSLITRARD